MNTHTKTQARLQATFAQVAEAALAASQPAGLTAREGRALERMFYHVHKLTLLTVNGGSAVEIDLARERAERFAQQVVPATLVPAPEPATVEMPAYARSAGFDTPHLPA